MPRFVMLQHDHPYLHWDFMLEVNGALRTWRLADLPTVGASTTAELLGDHRLAYLDYEGPVSGDRGTVARWDSGVYEAVPDATISWQDRVVVRLHGQKVEALAELVRLEDGKWLAEWRSPGVSWPGAAGRSCG